MRKIAIRVHRWIGLALGLLFVLSGLTGSFNVFHRELDAWLNPAYWVAQSDAVRISPSEALDIARARHPTMRVSLLGLPVYGAPYTINFKDAALAGGDTALQFQSAIDPATGAVTGPRMHWGGVSLSREEFARTLYRLHYELLVPPMGHTIVGLAGLFLIGLAVLGLALWWPRNGNWRRAFSLKRSAHVVRQMFDLHRLVGAVSAVILLMLGFSGSYIVFPDEFHTATAALGKAESFPGRIAAQRPGSGVSIEDAIAIAERRFDDGTAYSVAPPADGTGTYRVRLKRTEEVHPLGRTYAWIEPASGDVLRTYDWTGQQGMRRFYAWQFTLHNGSLFGLPGRLVVFIAGFAPLMLFLSGWVVWRRKRRARALNERRRSETYKTAVQGMQQ